MTDVCTEQYLIFYIYSSKYWNNKNIYLQYLKIWIFQYISQNLKAIKHDANIHRFTSAEEGNYLAVFIYNTL